MPSLHQVSVLLNPIWDTLDGKNISFVKFVYFNTSRARLNGSHVTDDIQKLISVTEKILFYLNFIKVFPKDLCDNKSTLLQIMIWRRTFALVIILYTIVVHLFVHIYTCDLCLHIKHRQLWTLACCLYWNQCGFIANKHKQHAISINGRKEQPLVKFQSKEGKYS